MDFGDLVGATEIAERLGLAQSTTVHSWRRRYADFPAPVTQVAGAYLWRWSEVEDWAKATGRLPDDTSC